MKMKKKLEKHKQKRENKRSKLNHINIKSQIMTK